MSEFTHFLPGVDARGIRDALKSKGAMPLQTELPGLEAAPEVVAAALRGVDVVDMNRRRSPLGWWTRSPRLRGVHRGTRREAHGEHQRHEIAGGLGGRGIDALSHGAHHPRAALRAPSLLLPGHERLNQRYDRTDLEAVERVWVLSAIDDRWQRHLVERCFESSVRLVERRGQLDPMEFPSTARGPLSTWSAT